MPGRWLCCIACFLASPLKIWTRRQLGSLFQLVGTELDRKSRKHWTLDFEVQTMLCPISKCGLPGLWPMHSGRTDFMFPRSPFLFLSRVSTKHGSWTVLDPALRSVWFLERTHSTWIIKTIQHHSKTGLPYNIVSVADLRGSWESIHSFVCTCIGSMQHSGDFQVNLNFNFQASNSFQTLPLSHFFENFRDIAIFSETDIYTLYPLVD
jgi:hypothetical protein